MDDVMKDKKKGELCPVEGASAHYTADYFEWQNKTGKFGGWANVTNFEQYIKPTDKVLDSGCAGGGLLKNLNWSELHGLELNDTARTFADNNNKISAYKYALMAQDEYFDIIISNNALEHCEIPFEELICFRGKLREGGKAVFTVPCERWDNPWPQNDIICTFIPGIL